MTKRIRDGTNKTHFVCVIVWLRLLMKVKRQTGHSLTAVCFGFASRPLDFTDKKNPNFKILISIRPKNSNIIEIWKLKL